MINPKDTVDAINAIPLAVSSARTSVVESLSRLGKKCDVMQEYHLEVGSEDPVIQKFIESRDEILAESDYFASYHGSYSPSSGDRAVGNGLLVKTKSAARPSSRAGSPKPKRNEADELRSWIKFDEDELAKFEKELKRAEAGEKTDMDSAQLESHIKFTKEKIEKKKAKLAQLEGQEGNNNG